MVASLGSSVLSDLTLVSTARPLHAAAVDARLYVNRKPFALARVRDDTRRRVHLHAKLSFVRHVLTEEHVVSARVPFPKRAGRAHR